jgi:hypothetical protein
MILPIEREKRRAAIGRDGHQQPPALGLDQGQRLARRQCDALDQRESRCLALPPPSALQPLRALSQNMPGPASKAGIPLLTRQG